MARSDWQDFLAKCAHRDFAVASWADSTKAKLFQIIVRILIDANYLENARSMKLTPQSQSQLRQVRQFAGGSEGGNEWKG